jgi:hypothetical protein
MEVTTTNNRNFPSNFGGIFVRGQAANKDGQKSTDNVHFLYYPGRSYLLCTNLWNKILHKNIRISYRNIYSASMSEILSRSMCDYRRG